MQKKSPQTQDHADTKASVHSKTLDTILLSLYLVVTALAIYIWGSQLGWNINSLSALTVFPVFGLAAFSLIWVHYVGGFIKDIWFKGANTERSFAITSAAVLALILLHPTLLVVELYLQGSGLPPASYKAYVGPNNVIFALLGTIGLVGLLLYETKRFFDKKSWWKYIVVVSDISVILIAIHSLRLGQNLQSGWFRYVWYFYIATIVLCIARIYVIKLQNRSKIKSSTK